MALMAYRLIPRPGSGFHLGREGLEQEDSAETFPSDSLFAALVAVTVQIEGEGWVEVFLSEWPFEGTEVIPPFRLSSLFPYVGDIPLFPMPRLRVNLADEEHPRVSKMLKKLGYVSPAILSRLLAGQPMNDWLPEQGGRRNRGVLLHEGQVWIAEDEIPMLPEPVRGLTPERLYDTKLWSTKPVSPRDH